MRCGQCVFQCSNSLLLAIETEPATGGRLPKYSETSKLLSCASVSQPSAAKLVVISGEKRSLFVLRLLTSTDCLTYKQSSSSSSPAQSVSEESNAWSN